MRFKKETVAMNKSKHQDEYDPCVNSEKIEFICFKQEAESLLHSLEQAARDKTEFMCFKQKAESLLQWTAASAMMNLACM